MTTVVMCMSRLSHGRPSDQDWACRRGRRRRDASNPRQSKATNSGTGGLEDRSATGSGVGVAVRVCVPVLVGVRVRVRVGVMVAVGCGVPGAIRYTIPSKMLTTYTR